MTSTTSRYMQGIPLAKLQLALVGKDPFPTSPTQIPFCKSTWKEQLASNCSGRHVLASIGVILSDAESQHQTPAGLFEELREVGIVFLNASYSPIGGTITRSRHLPLLANAYVKNEPILRASKNVIYCGEAWKVRWVAPTESGELVVHPDVRNKYNARTKDRWTTYWGEKALFKKLGLTLP